MKLAIATISLAIWGAAFVALPSAWATDDANQQAVIDEHKARLQAEYEESEQYKTIKAANESLKRIKRGGV